MALSDVIGHASAVRMIGSASQRGRIASAYLFSGEEGIGKRFTAFNLAKALNCLHPVTDSIGPIFIDACEQCSSCRKINRGNHPDMLVIEPDKGMIKVAQIKHEPSAKNEDGEPFRSVEEFLSFKAYEARTRVIIVDDAHLMNISAANAFLKTLEEPPAGTVIILVSAHSEWLPMTIRSRCCTIRFHLLGSADSLRVIGKAKDAPVLAALSLGQPGLALGGNLIKERNAFYAALREMQAGAAKPLWKSREDIERWFDLALVFLRDMAVIKSGGGVPINSDMADDLAAMSAKPALKGIIDSYGLMREIRENLRFNLNKNITWNHAGRIMSRLLGGSAIV